MVGAEPQANTNTEHISGAGATGSNVVDSHDLATGGAASDGIRGFKRNRIEDEDDEEEKPRPDRRKIEIKFIQDKSRRHITFSKRKAGIMKKAYELSVLTGTQVLLLVVSETGLVYTFTTPKLQPLVTKAEGKNLIQACLNAPEPNNQHMEPVNEDAHGQEDVIDEVSSAHGTMGASGSHANRGNVPIPPYHFPDHQQAAAYQQLIAAQQAQHAQQVHQQRGTYQLPNLSMGSSLPQHGAQQGS